MLRSLKRNNIYLKISNSSNLGLYIFLVLVSIFHLFIQLNWGDDVLFYQYLNEYSMSSLLIFRWQTWSSRLVIEFFLTLFSRVPSLWKILDVLIFMLIAYSIKTMFNLKNSKTLNFFVPALIMILPLDLFYSTGWIATTMNYSWPLAFGLFSFISIKKTLLKEEIKWYEYILYVLSAFYAINQEQMCIIVLMVYATFFIYFLITKHQIKKFILIQSFLAFLSLIFIMTCPGNLVRKAKETVRWFEDFDKLPLFRKLEMGFSSTLFEFIMKPNFLFTVFCILIVLCIFLKFRNSFYRLISLIPITVILIFGIFYELFDEIFKRVKSVRESLTKYGTGITPSNLKSFIPDIILAIVCAAVIICLYKIFNNRKKSLLAIFILSVGFISRLVMSFSPTIWGSISRTFTFMYASILICSVMLFNELLNYKISFSLKECN